MRALDSKAGLEDLGTPGSCTWARAVLPARSTTTGASNAGRTGARSRRTTARRSPGHHHLLRLLIGRRSSPVTGRRRGSPDARRDFLLLNLIWAQTFAPAELCRAVCRKVRVGRLRRGLRGRTCRRQSDGGDVRSCLGRLYFLRVHSSWALLRARGGCRPKACLQSVWVQMRTDPRFVGGARTADRAVSGVFVSGTCGGMRWHARGHRA